MNTMGHGGGGGGRATLDISAVLAVFNGEQYLQEAVESVLEKTFGDFELLIVDDGSTDGTSAMGVDGIFVPYGVPYGKLRAFAGTIVSLLSDTERAAKMGSSRYGKVMREYTWEAAGARVGAAYARMIGSNVGANASGG